MIEITNLTRLKEKEVLERNTYGFFSLGCIEDDNIFRSLDDSLFGFSCNCTIGGEESFDLLLIKVGKSDKYIVLSDFSGIPDIAVINNEEVLESLKSTFNEHTKGLENLDNFTIGTGLYSSQDTNLVYGPYLAPTSSPMIDWGCRSNKNIHINYYDTTTLNKLP